MCAASGKSLSRLPMITLTAGTAWNYFLGTFWQLFTSEGKNTWGSYRKYKWEAKMLTQATSHDHKHVSLSLLRWDNLIGAINRWRGTPWYTQVHMKCLIWCVSKRGGVEQADGRTRKTMFSTKTDRERDDGWMREDVGERWAGESTVLQK